MRWSPQVLRRPSWPDGAGPRPLERRTGVDYETEWARKYPVRLARAMVVDDLMRPLAHLVCSPRIEGLENLDSLTGPAIFAANHASHLDTGLLITCLPPSIRHRTAVAAAADYFFDRRWKAAAWAFALNSIPMERVKVNRRSAALAADLIEDGWNLVIFPEGGRTPDGWAQEFKGGAAYLAERSRTGVVPTYIHESGWLKGPRYAKAPLYTDAPSQGRHHVVVAFGEPLRCGEDENMRRFGTRVHEAVARLGREVSSDPDYGVARPDSDAPDEDTPPEA